MTMRKLLILLLFLPIGLFGQIPKVKTSVSYAHLGESGFPQIESGTQTGQTAQGTSHSITMPTGVQVGELIMVLFAVDGVETISINTGISGDNWTIESQNSANGTFDASGCVVWKIAEGSDVLTLTTTIEQGTFISYRITDFKTSDPLTVTNTTALNASNTYDPPSNTGDYGAVNYLWVVFAAVDNVRSEVASAAPTDFSDLTTQIGVDVAAASSSAAIREYNIGTAYDPGGFTASAGLTDYVTFTIIVNPK